MSPLFGPKPEAVLTRGTPGQGTIVGIRISYSHDDPPERLDDYAVLVNGTTYGVRQSLMPEGEVRLGMSVPVRVDGSALVIEWGDVQTYGWKSLSKVPASGIDDDSRGLGAARKKWTPATITLGAVSTRAVLMGLASVNDVAVEVAAAGEPPYETVIKKVQPAHYATHLLAPGTVVPGWIKPGRLDTVLIDWAAAALATPGVGAASALPDAPEPEIDPTQLPGFARKLGMTSMSPDEVSDPVDWDTFILVFKATGNGSVRGADADGIAQRHGVPAGEWDAAQARWMSRISKDMKLGMAFGQALNG